MDIMSDPFEARGPSRNVQTNSRFGLAMARVEDMMFRYI